MRLNLCNILRMYASPETELSGLCHGIVRTKPTQKGWFHLSRAVWKQGRMACRTCWSDWRVRYRQWAESRFQDRCSGKRCERGESERKELIPERLRPKCEACSFRAGRCE